MAIRKQLCVNHADRPAIGVCVITKRPICAECSTRYEGVNYSREGLDILHERRGATARGPAKGARTAAVVAFTLAPLMLCMVYLFYRVSLTLVIDLQQLDLLLL